MRIRVGSRESKLAVVQSEIVIDAIKKHMPEAQVELITMKTTGDIILDRTLDKIGGKGLFVKELDRALLNNEVDITVHSFKDMPMEVDEQLPIVAVSKREDPRDVLILPNGHTQLDFSKPIGCSSERRRIQLQKLFPNCAVKPVRGNVQKRLEKLDNGEYSALVLAYAGIKRLELEERIHRIFEVAEILPAACQGILVVQSRKG
ncbi:MAG: hydroxymethylbilane synthase, partial [Oscillospiraceae bacterium]